MARWDENGRWGEGSSRRGDEWREDSRLAGRGPSGRERWGADRETWRGGEDDGGDQERRDEAEHGWMAAGAPGRDTPAYRGPYRRGDDYGAREYGASDMGREYGTEWPGREQRRDGGAWHLRESRDQRVGRRWGGGDYTTYGQSGFDESERGAWMNEDLHREQGGGWRSHQHRGEHGRGMERVRGRGPKDYRRSDERIRDEICERIARSGIDAGDVEVRVEGGEVTLTGTAEDRHDKRMLEDLADEVFGVEEVQNHLRLKRPAAAGTTAGTGQGTQAGQGGQRPTQAQPPAGARH